VGVTIGIRREDKNRWERRVPLIPADVADLKSRHDLTFVVQSSPIRVFGDDEYRAAGAVVGEDLGRASIVVAVKEIPIELLRDRTTYLFFSHTIKGQRYNMPLLQRILDLHATLIDYERIVNEQNRRLIFFSRHAGNAGMAETLAALGRRLAAQGRQTPFAAIRPAHEYADLEALKAHLRAIGASLRAGAGSQGPPFVVGIAGYGNVAMGCRDVLDCLPAREIAVADLPAVAAGDAAETGPLVTVTFREEHLVEPRSTDAQFVLQDYYQHPENYRGVFERHLPHLDVLVNSIYWDLQYPRLVTRKWARTAWGGGRQPRLQVIGDISCDLEGAIELTTRPTMPDEPCYVAVPDSGDLMPGVVGPGPAIMAVDNLPCEVPRESSEYFSSVFSGMIPALARADFGVGFESLLLPAHLKKAVIAHRGALTPDYRYLQEYLERVRR
jgi:saccharopine dehydrogenase (NAD+, L-lysine forming)